MLIRASARTGIQLNFVSNHAIPLPISPKIRSIRVQAGFDRADQRISDEIQEGELLISQDIPLAAIVVAKGCQVITPRGDVLTHDTIKERLTMRNMMEELRGAGVQMAGPATLDQRDRQRFGNALDRWLSQNSAR
jgi:uncharacterized protein YaiI (UPF0178 family)